MFKISQVELYPGSELQQSGQLEPAANIVSQLLTDCLPFTKPKLVEELVDHPATSFYATIDGHAVGHANFSKYPDAKLVVGGGGRESDHYADVPHYGIESFVVMPGLQGLGIGKTILDFTVLKAVVAAMNDDAAKLVIISALASDNSYGLFKDKNFKDGSLKKFELGYAINLPPEKSLVYKVVNLGNPTEEIS